MKNDYQETEQLLAYLRAELNADEASRLEKKLMEDELLRRQLLELSVEESILTDWANAEHAHISLDNKVFEDSGTPSGSSTFVRFPSFQLAAAAAIVILGITAFLASKWRSSDGELVASEVVEVGVARVVASMDVEWRRDSHHEKETLPAGHYELASGSIDLVFADGARVSVGGPAKFELVSSRHIHLDNGNLVARIPDEALGFIVTSPQSEVIDLGTEFGLSVSKEGLTDVHVIDGLVEVFPEEKGTEGVKIYEGEARRFEGDSGGDPTEIPLSSRALLLGDNRYGDLGVEMLRGSVRIASGLSAHQLTEQTSGPHWIDLIAEKQGVVLTDPIQTTLASPGTYREFGKLDLSLPAGTRVNSYLLHFRPSSTKRVRGVIRFDQAIVGVICCNPHLIATDSVFGVPSVSYPPVTDPRGLEPGVHFDEHVAKYGYPENFKPDEIILSQDRSALSIHITAVPEFGHYDQVRVLTLAPESN